MLFFPRIVAAQLSEVQEREIQLREQISSLESERDYEKKSRENAQFQMSCLAKEMDRLRAASAAEIELTNQQRCVRISERDSHNIYSATLL